MNNSNSNLPFTYLRPLVTDKEQAARILFDYIETWYNLKKLHSALGYVFSEEFGRNLNKQNIAA